MNIEDKTIKFYFKDLQPGVDGLDGKDGVSPVITVEDIENGHRIMFTDAEGVKTFDVPNGTNGTDGKDGVSPLVDVEPTASGHRVTFLDAEGETTFDVKDGETPTPSIDQITSYFLNENCDNLMALVDDRDPSIEVTASINGNRIISTASACGSNEQYYFLLSKNIKSLGKLAPVSISTVEPYLTDDDFNTIYVPPTYNLYMTLTGSIKLLKENAISTMGPTIYVIGEENGRKSMKALGSFSGGSITSDRGETFLQLTYQVPFRDVTSTNEDNAKRIAFMFRYQPYYTNLDMSINFSIAKTLLYGDESSTHYLAGLVNNSVHAIKDYKVNDYFIRNGTLFRVIRNITKGNTFTAGDFVSTSIADELKELRERIDALS